MRAATPSAPEVEPVSGEPSSRFRDPMPTEDRQEAALPVPVRDRATLTMVIGPEPGRVFSLSGGGLLLGRSAQCDVRIEEAGVSRRHASLYVEGGAYAIADQGSRNGTSIDGVRISSKQPLADGARIGLGPSVSLRFALADEAEERCQKLLYEASVIDPLTGAANRKHLHQRLACEIAFARRHDQPLSILLLDLDNLKRTNDKLGHLAGDVLLKGLTDIVRAAMRTEDFVARYGGDEFVIVARGIGLAKAVAMAERLRKIVEKASIDVGHVAVSVTVSIGVASLSCCRPACSAEDLIRLADERLYAAKGRGRNRVDFTPAAIGRVG